MSWAVRISVWASTGDIAIPDRALTSFMKYCNMLCAVFSMPLSTFILAFAR